MSLNKVKVGKKQGKNLGASANYWLRRPDTVSGALYGDARTSCMSFSFLFLTKKKYTVADRFFPQLIWSNEMIAYKVIVMLKEYLQRVKKLFTCQN